MPRVKFRDVVFGDGKPPEATAQLATLFVPKIRTFCEFGSKWAQNGATDLKIGSLCTESRDEAVATHPGPPKCKKKLVFLS